MLPLSTFVLVGTVVSYDSFLATIEFDLNPPANGGPGLAVMPVSAIPCEIKVGKKIYIVKYNDEEIPTITCKKEISL